MLCFLLVRVNNFRNSMKYKFLSIETSSIYRVAWGFCRVWDFCYCVIDWEKKHDERVSSFYRKLDLCHWSGSVVLENRVTLKIYLCFMNKWYVMRFQNILITKLAYFPYQRNQKNLIILLGPFSFYQIPLKISNYSVIFVQISFTISNYLMFLYSYLFSFISFQFRNIYLIICPWMAIKIFKLNNKRNSLY